jgi:hypothetical protein
MAAVGVVRAALERHIGRDPDPTAEEELARSADAMPAPPGAARAVRKLRTVAVRARLAGVVRRVELHGSIGPLCATAQADPRWTHPTFSLALAALPEAHWSAITPGAPLRYWRLVEPGPGDAITTSPLRIDERILHYLTGQQYLDERLQGLVTPGSQWTNWRLARRAGRTHLGRGRRRADDTRPSWLAIQLCGPDVFATRRGAGGS